MTAPAAPESFRCDSHGDVRVGAVLAGTYRIIGLLGSGGMGTVYEAQHLRLGAQVALKVLRTPADAQAARRLLREARLTAGLPSDHLVRVADCGTLADDTPYVVMERLRGEDLRVLLAREGQLSVQRALRIVIEICAGLADLHAANIIHRDLKPANVFVLETSVGSCRCKLLDLGIARSNHSDSSHSAPLAGSLRYMAPEQFSDAKGVGAHSDVYAAGVILYQCLAGMLPHQGETPEEVLFSILNREPRSITELRPELSADLSDLAMRAIERDPASRPRSAAEFARALSELTNAATTRQSSNGPLDATTPELSVKIEQRQHGVGAWSVLVVAALTASLIWGLKSSPLSAKTTQTVAAKSSPSPVASVVPRSLPATHDEGSAPNANVVSNSTLKPTHPAQSARSSRPRPTDHPHSQPPPAIDLEKNPYAE